MKDQRVYTIQGNKMYIGILGNGLCMARAFKRVGKEIPICPICDKEITDELVYTGISNNAVLPNVMFHEACVKDPDIEHILNRLYFEHKDFLKQRRKWEGR